MGRRSSETSAQKREAVLAVLSKCKTISEVCRELVVSEQTFHRWRNAGLEGMENALGGKVDVNAREAELSKRLAEAERDPEPVRGRCCEVPIDEIGRAWEVVVGGGDRPGPASNMLSS